MATPTQELVSRLATDQEFRQRVESAGSPEEARSIFQEAGYEPDRQEAERLRQHAQEGELSDEELNAVLGGSSSVPDTVIIAAASIAAVP